MIVQEPRHLLTPKNLAPPPGGLANVGRGGDLIYARSFSNESSVFKILG
jgi:hypothetical protein